MMVAWPPQFTENPPILISMYSGTATMPYPTNSALSALYYIGQRTFVPVNNLLDEEHSTIQQALLQCNYPNWAINRTKLKMNTPKSNNRSNSNKTINKGHITVSYEEGLSESVKNICKRYGIEVHLKSGKSIKDELVAPKDKDHLTKKSGIIYRYKCDRLEV